MHKHADAVARGWRLGVKAKQLPDTTGAREGCCIGPASARQAHHRVVARANSPSSCSVGRRARTASVVMTAADVYGERVALVGDPPPCRCRPIMTLIVSEDPARVATSLHASCSPLARRSRLLRTYRKRKAFVEVAEKCTLPAAQVKGHARAAGTLARRRSNWTHGMRTQATPALALTGQNALACSGSAA